MALPDNCDFSVVPNPCDQRAENRNWDAVNRALKSLCEAVTGGGDPPGGLFGNLLVRFRLTAALVQSGNAAAVRIDWNGSAWVDGIAITVYDDQTGGMWQGAIGYEGWARAVEDEATRHSIVIMQRTAYVIWGTLDGALAGGSTPATVTAYSDGVNPGSPVTVHDRNSHWPQALGGATFQALYDFEASRYELLNCQKTEWVATAISGQDFVPSTLVVSLSSVTFKTYSDDDDDPTTPATALNSFGLTGFVGDSMHIQRRATDNAWEILVPDRRPTSGGGTADALARFRLTANLAIGGNALAKRLTFDGAGYNVAETIRLFDAPYPLTAGSPGGSRGMWSGIASMEGWCRKRAVKMDAGGPDEYEIVWMEQYAKKIHFTLTENMGATTAQQANATVEYAWDQGDSPGATLIVHDDLDMWHFARVGSKGTAIRNEYLDTSNPGTPYYSIVTCQQQFLYGRANAITAMCPGDETVQVSAFRGFTPSIYNVPLPEGQPAQAKNTWHLACEEGDLLFIAADFTDPNAVVWNVVQVDHQFGQIVTQIRFFDRCIQYKRYEEAAIMTCSPESDWINVICGEECLDEG